MAIDETFRINKVHETVTERKLFVLVNEICWFRNAKSVKICMYAKLKQNFVWG